MLFAAKSVVEKFVEKFLFLKTLNMIVSNLFICIIILLVNF